MSFKYRFILSFVILEAFFIILIVTVNFIAIDDSSKSLIRNKIKSTVTFMEQLVKVPLSIYDLATLDDLLAKTKDLEYIDSVIVLDSLDRVISKEYNFKHKSLEKFLKDKNDTKLNIDEHTYETIYLKIDNEGINLGSLYIIFDITENTNFIQKNKERTIIIVFLEILISTFLSYLIGNKLTQMLIRLTEVSEDIAQMKDIEIPFQDKKDEIGILAKSMDTMSKQINESYINLKQLTIIQDKQKKDLEEANKSKDDFLANMSHELKTPLNSINVISSIMMKNKKQSLKEEEVKNLKIINQCGNDLLFLINDVLDISKLEAGEMKLEYNSFNIKETMEEIKNMFEPQTKEKALDFLYEDKMTSLHVYSDRQRIKQIIKNLLSNSLKFVKNGYVKLSLEEDDTDFIISVEDNGIGIEEEKIKKIFDRFKQADNSTTRKFGGTGLGLSICKELSKLLGGDIIVESEVNKKTIFRVSLPKNSSKIYIKEHEATASNISKASDNSIIVLNNDPISLMNLIIALKKSYKVEQVTSLIELIKQEKENKYSFIILDTKGLKDTDVQKVINLLADKIILIDYKESNKFDSSVKMAIHKPINTQEVLDKIKAIEG